MAIAYIECTKAEFRDELIKLFTDKGDEPNHIGLEIIDGLVRQANAERGTFRGHNAALSVNFEVGGIRVEDEITIPAVTKTQAAQSYTAAATTTSQVASYLLILTRNGELSAKALAGEVEKLMAAIGHLTLAEQHEANAPKTDLAAEHMAKGGQLNGGIGHWSNH